MAGKIQIKRGMSTGLPPLGEGEFGFTLDSNRVYIGGYGGASNILVGSTSAAGADGYLQYNDGGTTFGATPTIYYNDTSHRLGIGTISPTTILHVKAFSGTNAFFENGRVSVGIDPATNIGVGANPLVSAVTTSAGGDFWHNTNISCVDMRSNANGVGGGISFLGKDSGGNYYYLGGFRGFFSTADNAGGMDLFCRGSSIRFFTAASLIIDSGTPNALMDKNGYWGLGTTTPKNRLDINGAAAIGSYAGSSTAPSNGLVVSGAVGVGTTTINTNKKMEIVGGHLRVSANGTTGGTIDFGGGAGNNYIYYSGSGSNDGDLTSVSGRHIVFQTAGTRRGWFDANGYFAINSTTTTTPSAWLHITTQFDGAEYLRCTSASVDQFRIYNNGSPNRSVLQALSGHLIFASATGYIGIGTNSPSEKLHLDVAANAAGGIASYNSNTGTAAAAYMVAGNSGSGGGSVAMYGLSSSYSYSSFAGVTSGSKAVIETGSSTSNGLWIGTYHASAPLVFYTANAERVRILPSGYVGINTSSPTSALDVVGNIEVTGGIQNVALKNALDGYNSSINDLQRINTQQSNWNSTVLIALDGYEGGGGGSGIEATVADTAATGDGYLAFFTGVGRNIAGDNDLYYDRVNSNLLLSGGARIGIGTADPGFPLDIWGHPDDDIDCEVRISTINQEAFLGYSLIHWLDGVPTGSNVFLSAYGTTDNGFADVDSLITYDGAVEVGAGDCSSFMLHGFTPKMHFMLRGKPIATMVHDGYKFGVGTTAPATSVHFAADDAAHTMELTLQCLNKDAGFADIAFLDGYNNYCGDIGMKVIGTGQKYYLDNWSNGPFTFVTSAGEVMNIQQDGKIGFGAATPATQLHIAGNQGGGTELTLQGLGVGSAWADIAFLNENGDYMGDIGLSMGSDTNFYISNQNNNTGFYTFYTKTGGSLLPRLTITNTGNVGIGNTSAPNKLSVVGDGYIDGYLAANRIYTNGLIINTADWALSGWGSDAYVSGTTGCDSHGTVSVVSGTGTGISANPTVTLTFKNGAWKVAPFAMAKLTSPIDSLLNPITESTTTTTLTLTFIGTPQISTAYIIKYLVEG